MDKAARNEVQGVTFDHLASVYEEFTGKIAVENLRPSWLIFLRDFTIREPGALSARYRRDCAVCGLVIAAPIMAIVAVSCESHLLDLRCFASPCWAERTLVHAHQSFGLWASMRRRLPVRCGLSRET